MSGWVGRALRTVTGLVVVGAAAGVAVAADLVPPVQAVAVPDAGVEVPPGRTTLVCPGGLVLPEDAGTGGAFDPVPVAPVQRTDAVRFGGAGEVTLTGADGVVRPLIADAGAGSAVVEAPGGPGLLLSTPSSADQPRVTGVTSAQVAAGDLRGLSAATCQAPGADLWLVGGSTATGATADLVLTNPGSTPAEVTLQVWGPAGPAEVSGVDTYLVAPGASRTVSLGGVAAEQRRLVVRVTSQGGAVTATLQDTLLDGFTAAGTDLVVPGAAPATEQVVPGVSVSGADVDGPDAASLRLLAVEADTVATITVIGQQGTATLPGAEQVRLVAGEVTDLSLGGLAAGAYTLVVSADSPVLAAAMVARAGAPTELDDVPTLERAWAASVLPATAGAVAVPQGTTGWLALTAPGVAEQVVATLTYARADGSTGSRGFEVEPGVTVAVPVSDLGGDVVGVTLDADVPVAWALVALVAAPDGELVSVVGPSAPDVRVTSVTVRQGRLP